MNVSKDKVERTLRRPATSSRWPLTTPHPPKCLRRLRLSFLTAKKCRFRLAASLHSPSTSRWLFGAKFSPGSDVDDAIEAAEMMIRACPAYDTAGYGTALDGTSSYYDIVLYVDSKDSSTTASQAGCMVEKLSNDPNLANRLTGGLLDAAEISIELSPGGSG